MRLHNYTLKFLTPALLVIVAIWALLFYAYILDEVHDNTDDGLKNTKIQIIKEAYKNPKILQTTTYGINNFRITPLPENEIYSTKNVIISTEEYMEYDDEEEPIRLLTTHFRDSEEKPYKLEIKTSMIEEDDLLFDLARALVILYVSLVISIFSVNYFMLKKVWKIFYKLLDHLKKYTFGSKEKFKIPDTKIKEFQDLEAGIQKMIDRNEIVFEHQKQFISNAAHELQTPLAISMNKLELLSEYADITEKQLQEIASINDTINRLIKLNKSLLLLSRIENNQFQQKENINFNQLIKEIVEDFEDFANFKQIKFSIIDKGSFEFNMDKGLAITLINNLIKNAMIHNLENHGEINISITENEFRVENTSNISELDQNVIYNRFYRSTTDNQSTGLGLPVVKTIIDYNPPLKMSYSYVGKHIFKVFI